MTHFIGLLRSAPEKPPRKLKNRAPAQEWENAFSDHLAAGLAHALWSPALLAQMTAMASARWTIQHPSDA